MKTRLLKFVRKHLYDYDGLWIVTNGGMKSLLLCQLMNTRREAISLLNTAKKTKENEKD